MENDDFIQRYEAAFKAANPESEVPVIQKHGMGWYRFADTLKKMRRAEIEQMTANLEARVSDQNRIKTP